MKWGMLQVILCLSTAQACAGGVGDCPDGQTCLLTSEAYSGPVRLYCISAPALTEPYGIKAREQLRSEVRGTIRVLMDSQDGGIPIAEFIRDDGFNLGLEMIAKGLAKVDRVVCDEMEYIQAEQIAQENSLGLWSRPGEFKCKGPRYCNQVKSCEEAMFYLEHCGRTDLDRDRDGIPCEGLCAQLSTK